MYYLPSVFSDPDQGSSVSLQCVVDSNPAPSITWTRSSQPGVIIGEGEELVITDIQPSMSDVYICEAENEVGIGEGRSEPLMTRHAPVNVELRPETESVLVTTGQQLIISCEAQASPAPEFTWLHSSGGVNLVAGHGASLTLESVTYADAGQYHCSASNTLGESLSRGLVLEVRGAPVVEQSLTSVDAVEGEQMSVGVKFCSLFHSNPTLDLTLVTTTSTWTMIMVTLNTLSVSVSARLSSPERSSLPWWLPRSSPLSSSSSS